MLNRDSIRSKLPFKKNVSKGPTIEVMEFNTTNIDSSSISKYFKHLKKDLKLGALWMNTKVVHGQVRCVIKCFTHDHMAQMYFADRCPAMVEEEIKKFAATDKAAETDKNYEDYAPSTCFVTGLPYAECHNIANEIDKSLKYPTIILHERRQNGFFVFHVGLPTNYSFTGDTGDPINLLGFFKEFCNYQISIYRIEWPTLPMCIKYEIQTRDPLLIRDLVHMDIEDKRTQLFNELNSKLRRYIMLP